MTESELIAALVEAVRDERWAEARERCRRLMTE
jgi:hypothetical protein